MKYDDVTYHLEQASERAAAVHLGLFFSWSVERGLAGALHQGEAGGAMEQLRARAITGAQYVLDRCDGQLTDEDLNAQGNAFAEVWYGQFLADLEAALPAGVRSPFELPDNWETAERLWPLLDRRFAEWKAGKRPPPPPRRPLNRVKAVAGGGALAGLALCIVGLATQSGPALIGGAGLSAVALTVLFLRRFR